MAFSSAEPNQADAVSLPQQQAATSGRSSGLVTTPHATNVAGGAGASEVGDVAKGFEKLGFGSPVPPEQVD